MHVTLFNTFRRRNSKKKKKRKKKDKQRKNKLDNKIRKAHMHGAGGVWVQDFERRVRTACQRNMKISDRCKWDWVKFGCTDWRMQPRKFWFWFQFYQRLCAKFIIFWGVVVGVYLFIYLLFSLFFYLLTKHSDMQMLSVVLSDKIWTII